MGLPFKKESLGTVESNLVFLEAAEVADERELLQEAPHVARRRGKLAFQDLFLGR
jgi:hypothetical protein